MSRELLQITGAFIAGMVFAAYFGYDAAFPNKQNLATRVTGQEQPIKVEWVQPSCPVCPVCPVAPPTPAGGQVDATGRSCLHTLSILPKPLMVAQAVAKIPYQLVVADPAKDQMISKTVLETGLWDVHVLKALEDVGARPCALGGIAIDAGTNLGFFTNALLAMGCKVHGFEMQQAMADRVQFSACSNGFADRLTMHVGAISDQRGLLSMVKAEAGNLGGVGIVDPAADKITVPVIARRIDEIMDLNTEVSVMKMDIEGHEPKALQGMQRMFEKRLVKNIVMEFTPTVSGEKAAADNLDYLYSHGFTVVTELDFMAPTQYPNTAQTRVVDTSEHGWAQKFANKIINGGDSRGLKFTDLLLQLAL